MAREELNMLKYTIALIAEFASRFHLGERQAYNYLRRFKGMEYLKESYGILHTLSFNDAVETMAAVCEDNGGKLHI